jgi:hypothetical protein
MITALAARISRACLPFRAAGVLLLSLAVSIPALSATTYTWTGGQDNRWSNPNNWNPFGTPVDGDSLGFPPDVATTSLVNDLPMELVLRAVVVTGGGYSISGNRLVLTETLQGGAARIDVPVSLQGLTSSTLNNVTLNGALSISTPMAQLSSVTANDIVSFSGSTLNVVRSSFASSVDFQTGTATLDTVTFGGPVSGSGELRITEGSLGGNHPFSGTIRPNSNRLLDFTGLIAPAASFGSGVNAQGMVQLSGEVGNVDMTLFQLTAGRTIGTLTTGNLRLQGGQLVLRIQGTTPGTGHDHINVNGTVTLQGISLGYSMSPNFVPTRGDTFVLIANDGTDPVVGTFTNVSEGGVVRLNSIYDLVVSYRGGDGNDVTLTSLNGREPSTTTLEASANPSDFGQPVILTARVTAGNGEPTGSVTFFDGATILQSVALTLGVAQISTSSLTVGVHNLRAEYGGDSTFGGGASSVITLIIERRPQVISFPQMPSRGIHTSPVLLAASGGPSGNDVIFTSLTPSTCATTGSTGSTLTLLALGTCTVEANQAGNAEYAAAAPVQNTFQIQDNTPPDTTITSGPPPLSNSTTATFQFTGTDAHSAVTSFICTINGNSSSCVSGHQYTGLAQGSYTVTVAAVDAAGNTDPTPASYSWTVDLTGPAITIVPIVITSRNEAAYSFQGTCSEEGRVIQVQVASIATTATCTGGMYQSADVDATSLAQGTVSLSATIIDDAGNAATATASTIKDTIGPVVTIDALDPINAANFAAYPVRGNCEDGGNDVNVLLQPARGAMKIPSMNAACQGGRYLVVWNTSALPDGGIEVQVVQLDRNKGNETWVTGSVVKDIVAPGVALDPPAPITAANHGAYAVLGSCSDNGATVELHAGTVAGTATCTSGAFAGVLNVSALPDGPVSLTARLVDAAGNQATATATAAKDATVAVLNITSPADGATVSPNPAILGTSAEAGATVTVREGANVVCAVNVTAAGDWSCASSLGLGAHTITATQTDTSGNVSALSTAVTFSVKAAASVGLSQSSSTTNVGEPVLFTATVTGPVAPTGSVTFLDGTATLCANVAIASGNAQCSTSALAAGAHSITASYSGDANLLPAASNAVTHQVNGAVAAIHVSPGRLDFGGQLVGSTSADATVTVTNTGSATLTITSVTVSGPFPVAHACSNVAPGASCEIDVAFAPAATGTVAGVLTIGHSAAGGVVEVQLSGTGQSSLVSHFYQSILGRAGEAGGMQFWTAEAGRTSALGIGSAEVYFAIATSFFGSTEYAARGVSDMDFVRDLYETFLGRAPDAGGLAYWSQQLALGVSRESLLVEFARSVEFSRLLAQQGGTTASRPEADMVTSFYRGILARLPDSGGFRYWLQRFRVAQCASAGAVGSEADAVSHSFFNLPEYASRARDTKGYVSDLYNAFMGRAPDVGGLNHWVRELDSGRRTREELRITFMRSAEFQARVEGVVRAGCVI